jgi:uncharacterized peroxidase-related enzyme
MPYIGGLTERDGTLDVFARFADLYSPFVDFCENVFWGASPISEKDRQIVYAYVSRLNGCDYCYGGHNALAQSYGAAEDLLDRIVEDLDRAPVDAPLRALLVYARKLTLAASSINAEDARALLAAGWSDEALHSLVVVCALANFQNRFADGLGLVVQPGNFAARVRNARELGYRRAFDAKVAQRRNAK